MTTRRSPRTPVTLVLRRAGTRPVLTVAAFLTVLLSAVSLTAVIAYGSSVPERGLAEVLAADPANAAIEVSAAAGHDGGQTADAALRTLAATDLAPVDSATVASLTSTPYTLRSGPGPAAAGGLTSFWTLTDLPDVAHLTAGRWPGTSSAGVAQVAVSRAAADTMGVTAGSRLELTSATFAPPVSAVVVGVYEPDEPTAGVWALDPTGGAGVSSSQPPSYGPLAVTAETFRSRFAASATASWLIQPDVTGVSSDQLSALAAGLATLRTQISAEPSLGASANVTTGLGDLLERASRSVVVSRSTTPVPVLLLAIIAGYAVCYVGWLLLGERRTERDLLRARGAAPAQEAWGVVAEAALLVIPAAVLAPILCALLWPAVAVLVGHDAPPWSQASGGIVTSTVAIALGGILALAAPGLLTAVGGVRRRAGRDRPRAAWQRAGVDLAVVALALASYALLRSTGSPFATADVRSLRIDPVFVLAPVLLLGSSALLGLRLLPLLTGVIERLAARGSGAGVALGVWPVSRRPSRHAGPLLLLVLAVSVGVLSVVSTATGARSQRDQADFAVGADVRADLVPGSSPGRDKPVQVPGERAAMAVSHQLVDTGAADGSLSSLLALDAAVAPGIVALRPDLTATGTAPYDALGRSSADGDGLPALATTALLAERGLRVGDRLDTIVGRSQVPVRVVGEVSGFPTLGSTDGLVVDATMLRRATGGQGSADQWWYAVDEGAATQAGAALAADPVVAAVSDRWTLAAALEQDPLAQGFTGSLQIALIVGTVLAAMGYGVSVLLSGRERRSELLLLRALGGSPREVRSALVIEQLLVLGLGIALGLVVGLVVAALVVPLTTVSARTGAVVPPAVTTVPWAHLIILVLGLVTVLVAVSAVVTSRVGRAQIATGLRQEVAP